MPDLDHSKVLPKGEPKEVKKKTTKPVKKVSPELTLYQIEKDYNREQTKINKRIHNVNKEYDKQYDKTVRRHLEEMDNLTDIYVKSESELIDTLQEKYEAKEKGIADINKKVERAIKKEFKGVGLSYLYIYPNEIECSLFTIKDGHITTRVDLLDFKALERIMKVYFKYVHK